MTTSDSLTYIPVFETKSSRVKGIAFHPTRPWLLSSLHNGSIQLWDYRIKSLIDRFGDHDGPVRSVDFHHSQPLFVSGGDDYKIKIWNYRERRCIFTLSGHVDYVRTVQFHHESPWILSASDDQTVRIWNWQSRQCISVLSGHSHYVMCARFHPSEDLVVSSSLDQTVRVWDISGLRRRGIIAPVNPHDASAMLQNEIFGSTDAIVKFVLEGHDRGVNWAEFHPTSPVVISAADDRQIKLWRMSDQRAWEIDTLRGHSNNVCSISIHQKDEYIISISEDKTIRIWNANKFSIIKVFRRDSDRFWSLASHPKLNLFAAGHDTGLVIFKLSHERPPYHNVDDKVLAYIKDRHIRTYNFESGRDVPIASVKIQQRPRYISYNPKENSVLVTYTGDSGDRYEIINLSNDGKSEGSTKNKTGRATVWIRRDRFAVLEKNIIYIKDSSNEVKKKITPPHSVDNIFSAGTDSILLRSEEKLSLYDVVQECPTGHEIKVPQAKDAIWSRYTKGKSPIVAIICESGLVFANQKLEVLFSIPEIMRVKSGVWDDNGTFIYTTYSHIKYALPTGDHGIVRTVDRTIYITATKGNKIFCMNRQGEIKPVIIDTTEYAFKSALSSKRFDEVMTMVKNSNLIGQSIIGFLQRHGYPEIALHFVKDEKTRFNLALECSNMKNLDIALQSAKALDDNESWSKLGTEALRQGNHQIVEKAYQQTLDFERLSFLYLTTGNQKNLSRMLGIANEKRKDPNASFFNTLLLGNIEERVRVLEGHNQLQLAYVTATTHGLFELANNIKEKLERNHLREYEGKPEEEVPPLLLPVPIPNAKLLIPPTPILRFDKSNWPMTRVTRGLFEEALLENKGGSATSRLKEDNSLEPGEEAGNWGEELNLSEDDDNEYATPEEKEISENEGGWGKDDDDILEELEEIVVPSGNGEQRQITLPAPGQSIPDYWSRTSLLAVDSIAAGKFEEAMRLLNNQIGAVNFLPLKPLFIKIRQSSLSQLVTLGGLNPLTTYLERKEGNSQNPGFPKIPINMQTQIDQLSNAYKAITGGKFIEAKEIFQCILTTLPLIVAQNPEEANEIKEFIGICKEYLIGISMELKRKELMNGGAESKKSLELASYFTNCELQTKHIQLSLKSAMNSSIKMKNYGLASDFANRLLDLNPPESVVEHTRKVLRLCEQKNFANELPIDYDSRNPFTLCGYSLTPIYQGTSSLKCPYCETNYKTDYKGKVCVVCNIAEIGKEAEGLVSIEISLKKKKDDKRK